MAFQGRTVTSSYVAVIGTLRTVRYVILDRPAMLRQNLSRTTVEVTD